MTSPCSFLLSFGRCDRLLAYEKGKNVLHCEQKRRWVNIKGSAFQLTHRYNCNCTPYSHSLSSPKLCALLYQKRIVNTLSHGDYREREEYQDILNHRKSQLYALFKTTLFESKLLHFSFGNLKVG